MKPIKLLITKLKNKYLLALLIPIVLLVTIPLPSPLFDKPFTTTIETADGVLLGAMIADDGQWRFPASDSFPLVFEQALLHFEDEYFYNHFGINPFSILKALKTNWERGGIKRGGSTITMQVIRMARGNRERTVYQKMIETILSVKLEILYSKKEILNLYANNAPFGGNVVGLSSASWRYYGRPEEQLSWAEAAALAVLPNQPGLIFPGRNSLIFKSKRNRLLKKLLSRGVIDSITYELAIAEELPQKPLNLPRLAPHLLTRAVKEGKKGRQNIVTIDPVLQRQVKQLANNHTKTLSANQIHNAAIIVIELMSGKTKAYIGNVDTDSIHHPSVDIINAQRSTGSLLKPFLYASALDEGLISPKQLLKDYPVFYEGFSPKNFDLKYRGAVHADEALTRSLNLPFVMLLKDYGLEKFHQKLKRIGMKSLTKSPNHYGLSMVLGGAESSLWELSNMYANLYRVYRNSFEQPTMNLYDADNYIEHSYLQRKNVTPLSTDVNKNELSVASIWATLEALKGLHRPDDFAAWQSFDSSTPISWKTGTSFGFRDAWSIGMNGKYLVGVWVGNADGEGRPGLVGGKAAAPLMFQVFELLEHTSFDDEPTSETDIFKICQKSGQKSSENCTETYIASLPNTVASTPSCEYHQLIHLDKNKQFQVSSSCYDVNEMLHTPWFILPPVQAWYYKSYNSDYRSLPSFMSGCESANNKGIIQMIYPREISKIYIPKELDGSLGQVVFEAAHSDNKQVIYWHLDEVYIGSTKREHQMGIFTNKGKHKLLLLDQTGEELKVNFEVISE